ncbi:hypothetical protein ACTHGU_00280 [Chitinophagaceae bacterium MMS25-I14]
MNRSNWKKYTLLLSSAAVLLILGERLVQACADPGDPYDYYPSFFSNNVLNEKPYTPFFYTANLKYYDEWYEADTSNNLPDQNIAEWRSYTGNTVPEADLDSFVYKYPYSELSGLYYNIEKAKPLQVSQAMASNAFTKWFIANKDLEALGYLMYAKQCEPQAAGGDYWQPVQRDTAKLGRLERNGLKLHAAAKKDFFKWRYAYQVLRMAFYGGDSYENTITLYDKLIGNATADNIMYPRCLSLKAGALYHSGHKAEAAYLYSKVFDKSDEIKKTTYISYDWSRDSTSEEDILGFCKNDHEKAVLYVMEGLHNYDNGLELMQKAYRLDPGVHGLNVLMTREINKLEERYMQDKLMQERNLNASVYYYYYNYSFNTYNDASTNKDSTARVFKNYLNRLGDFAGKLAQDKKAANNTFWNLSAAYISFMLDDAKACGKYLAKAEKAGMTDRERDQHDIIHLLYTMKSNPELNAKTEAKILPELQWLDNRAAKNHAFQKPYRDLMMTLLVTPYLKQRDTVKAIYCLARAVRDDKGGFSVSSDFTDIPGALLEKMNTDKLRTVEDFCRKNNKTPYEQWLTKNTPYDLNVLYELEGTKYIRDYNFRDAAATLKKVSSGLFELPNAFAAYTRDQLEYEDQDSVKIYTKLSYAEKMLALQQKLEADPKDANAAFDYATGLYSISYYGKAHNAWTYYRGTTDGLAYYNSKDRQALPAAAREFYEVKTAEKYFLQAYQNSRNAEFKAKALWMAAKCWQKRCPEQNSNDNSSKDDPYYKYSQTNPYYSQLKTEAGKTKYYNEVWNTCSYFKDYVKQH